MELISNDYVPNHVAFIPDGMRRWAIENNKELSYAYIQAYPKVKEVINEIFTKGTSIISSYALSIDNLKRDTNSLSVTINSTSLIFKMMYEDIAVKWNCRFLYAGNLDNIKDRNYVDNLLELCKKSENFSFKTIYLCVSYDPIYEISCAFENSKNENKPFFECLQVNMPIDLFIRTGKEHRLSNFLPLQIGYAELFFIDKYFLDIDSSNIKDAFDFYEKKIRRFGR